MRKSEILLDTIEDHYESLQCGRIYKDAEMGAITKRRRTGSKTFNVAASIKMRKCGIRCAVHARKKVLQCGRIYKDAEIAMSATAHCEHEFLQCGRIYKDAEIYVLILSE